PSRFEYERAIRRSSLPPSSRLLALTIATWADVRTGIIPDRYMPSLTVLEAATGLSRKTVRAHLDVLEAEGWVARDRPTAEEARRGARTRYRLMIPADAADAEDAEPVEPVEEVEEVEEVEPEPVDQAEPVEEGRGATPPPGEEVGAPRPHGRGATPPDKRRHAPTGMGATPPKSSMSSMSDVQSSPAPARGTTGTALADRTPTIETELADEPAAYAARLALAEHTSRPISPAHARAVAAAILARARGQVGDPVAYVTAAVHRDPTPHIPAPMPPTVAEATR